MNSNFCKISFLVCITVLLFGFTSCTEYQQVLKSKEPDLKYQKALTYFNDEQYIKAQSLLDDVTSYYRGTDRSQDVLAYLARCYIGQKDYQSASEYYQAYIRNYPKGRYITEARFQVGHCYYLDAPDARLDQSVTKKGIEFFTQFVELHPESPYAEQAYQEMSELYDKLAEKEYLSAKLYYNLGTYLGNNYLSAEIVAKNALKDYPTNKYQEELNWIILQAKYQQTLNSVEVKKNERARETEDEYYSFIAEFPDSKHRSAAERIGKEVQKMLDIKFLRENPELVKENIRKKFQDSKLPLVDEVIALDEELRQNKKRADDLRAGAALVLAGLCAEGKTVVTDSHYIKRGYSDFSQKLRLLGADVMESE